ncbi:hypothetical protein [Niallia oryzisoli]|uniref:hypothetical protein n=1 Tax=Niallia oryzisoli TaxID=1737571 RepID=UPI0037358F8F
MVHFVRYSSFSFYRKAFPYFYLQAHSGSHQYAYYDHYHDWQGFINFTKDDMEVSGFYSKSAIYANKMDIVTFLETIPQTS